MSDGAELTTAEKEYGALGLNADRFENIPRSLQGAGFLQWSARSDRPKRPHNDGDFRVSWSDPDEWVQFDEAVEGANKNESWGIGYVNGAENSDYSSGHRATIDLDGAIDENGDLREWVPSLEPFFERGAYIEYSVSLADVILNNETDGAGLHIPVRNAEIPEWWSDSELSDDLHQGVDVLANKFCTVTGVPYPEAGDEVVEYGKWLNEWLAEAYRRIRGEEPPRNGNLNNSSSTSVRGETDHSGRTGSTGDAAREDVEAALEYVGYAAPGDDSENALHYNDWRDIAYAVHSWDDGPEGREVFDNWTEESPKYEEPESKEAINWIWENASPSDDPDDSSTITLGTLFHEAKSNGWEGPEHTSVDFDPAAEWASWVEERTSGELGAEDVISEAALRHLAEDRGFYNFEAVEGEVGDLPPKAHNKALWWVKNEWADEFLDEDEEATARSYKARDAVVYSWEDVRYIYEDSKEAGRKAARDLLSSKYRFMTVTDSETLQIYDEDTGIYTDKIGSVRGEIYEELGEHWSTHELNEITAGLRQENVVEPRHLDAGDRDEALVCVGNGVLDLFERELHEHSPEYHFVNRVPINYDPDADTSVFENFVDELVAREEDADTLFEMVGHALLPDANERYKKFLILTGDADNGKSMFYDAVSALLNGPDGEESNTSGVKLAKLAQNRFSIYSMYGSLANIAGEIDGKKIRNTANLKDITGGDEVEIEPKGQDSFFDTLGTTLMFAANDPPILGERDKKAIASRIVPIELPYTFVENPSKDFEKQRVPERELRDKLEADEALAGLLNLALDGLERLEENHGDVSLPESPDERLERYERSADPMREFGTIALENDPDDYLVKADITTLYKHFAQQQGYEIGSKIGPVLHGVLRGIDTLNYTDSKPRHPDYTDTTLPLKGWDERKEVVDRVTLSEEGMKLAEDAGLVLEETDTEEPADNDALAARDCGYGHEFTATVENWSAGEYNREAQGLLSGESGTRIGFVVPGDNGDPLIGKQGRTLHFENVTIRTDEDGLLEAVINDATVVTEPSESGDTVPEPDATEATDRADASATDGGTPDESADMEGVDIEALDEAIIDELDSRGSCSIGKLAAALAEKHDYPPDKTKHRVEKLTERGDIIDNSGGAREKLTTAD